MLSVLFRKLRLVYDKCNENCAGLEPIPPEVSGGSYVLGPSPWIPWERFLFLVPVSVDEKFCLTLRPLMQIVVLVGGIVLSVVLILL